MKHKQLGLGIVAALALVMAALPSCAVVAFDMGAAATAVKDEITGNIGTVIPIAVGIFALSIGIPYILRLIRKVAK